MVPLTGKLLNVVEEIQDSSTVHLELVSDPESVALVRAMLSGVAELLDFDNELLDDLNTTVSEACNNVVVHAYRGEKGPLIVHLEAHEDEVEVRICDHGGGFQAAAPADHHIGAGLSLISALADRAEFFNGPGGGTEVRVAFGVRATGEPPLHDDLDGGCAKGAVPDIPGDVVVTLAPIELLAGVLGRMARLLAARARFSLERFSDLYLLVDEVSAHARRQASSPRMSFALSADANRLQLSIGPLREGTEPPAQGAASAAQSAAPLQQLADELWIEPMDHSQVLRVVVEDRELAFAG
jgi:serine/threonine-protein kinase RsbW